MKPYLAIDIETTGLEKARNQILQVAAVYDIGLETKIAALPTFNIYIKHDFLSGNPYALSMNSKTISEMSSGLGFQKQIDAQFRWSVFLTECRGTDRLTVAGKNVASFDIPFLEESGYQTPFKHRVIDVGAMYLTDFGYVPNLTEINTLLDRKPVSHDALEDCYDVVHAIREKFNKEKN